MNPDTSEFLDGYNEWFNNPSPTGGAAEMKKLKGDKMSYYEWQCQYCGKYNQYEGITQKTYICQYCGKEDKMTVGEFIVQKLNNWNNHKSDVNHIECSDFELLLKKIKEYYEEEME